MSITTIYYDVQIIRPPPGGFLQYTEDTETIPKKPTPDNCEHEMRPPALGCGRSFSMQAGHDPRHDGTPPAKEPAS